MKQEAELQIGAWRFPPTALLLPLGFKMTELHEKGSSRIGMEKKSRRKMDWMESRSLKRKKVGF
jgi:hypothetical protein